MNMETENPPPEPKEPEFDLERVKLDRPEFEEEIPEDFIVELFRFMDDVCRIEAFVDAASECLHARHARIGTHEEHALNEKRAFYLLESVRGTARRAALRALELHPQVVAYCEEAQIERPEPKEEE